MEYIQMKYYPKEIYYEVRGNVHYIVLVYEDSKVEHVIAAQPALALDRRTGHNRTIQGLRASKAQSRSAARSKMKKTLKEKILSAETKANNWLARANELREAGKDDSKAMAQAQKWLDKLNELEQK